MRTNKLYFNILIIDYSKQNYLKEYTRQITVLEIEDFLIFQKNL
jgi:3-deoxy-D-arabino-heptulosonate 7-phosphate (DAHP) synthase